MKTKLIIGVVILLFFGVGYANAKNAYFGVPNKALGAPKEFGQTEAAIKKAEKSPGARYCPEKIAKARELAKKGVETYWACRDKEAMAMLAEARKLAEEAELCKAPPKPAPPPPKPAPPPPKPAPPPPPPKKVIILKGVNFAFDSAKLTPGSVRILDEQVATLKENPTVKVEIAGHTDSTGPDAYNQGLSARRAKAVMDYFVSKGISPNRLKAVGYGESRPIAANDTREGRAKNRRVELHIFE